MDKNDIFDSMSDPTNSSYTISIDDGDKIVFSNSMYDTVSGVGDYIFSPLSNSINSDLKVDGNTEINGNLIVNGKNLLDSLERIESRLNIMHPNKDLESRWEELRTLGEKYRQLEAEILEKEHVWNIVKK